MTPQRFQRSRRKGWKKPDGAVYVGRGTQWGNPIRINSQLTRSIAVTMYRDEILKRNGGFVGFNEFWVMAKLRGKHLMCWCPLDQPCHADVLLELANRVAADPPKGAQP